MGPVVTTNSATLVNKGLEVIEAHLLFDIPFERIDVVVHPQSMVHSMVEFVDGSTIAQASPPSMLLPIALGLGWPDRVPDAGPACDWTTASTWEFFPLDDEAFPSVALARRVGRGGRRRTRRCSTRPTRSAWRRSSPAPSRSSRSSTRSRGWCDEWADGGQPGNDSRELTVESVLQAEAWARARARTVLGLAGAVGRETGKP